MHDKVAFITGASRGIGAESAVALAKAGYRVAITARTLTDGENHDHVGSSVALPGSLEATAKAVEKCRRRSLVSARRYPRATIYDRSSSGRAETFRPDRPAVQ